jgi:hypothetical protein
MTLTDLSRTQSSGARDMNGGIGLVSFFVAQILTY